jgi:hypothetical protein
MRSVASIVTVATLFMGTAIAGLPPRTTSVPGHAFDAPALPVRDVPGSLTPPRFESPPSLDTPAEIEQCAICRLAAATADRIPPGSFRVEGEMLEQGAALRLLSADPAVREALWKATLARGELLATLRAGAGLRLCAWCLARRETLAELDISARRIPNGVVLLYTSKSPEIVRQIHIVVRAGSDLPVRF